MHITVAASLSPQIRAIPGAAPVLLASPTGSTAWYADVDGDDLDDNLKLLAQGDHLDVEDAVDHDDRPLGCRGM